MREWLITNGIGGFAASTDKGGMNTRRYHGLLIAATNPPGKRKLILSKVDESIEINGNKYNLFTNNANGQISEGYKLMTSFKKDIVPVYRFKVENTIIEKTISLVREKNAVVILYKIMNQNARTKFYMTPIVNNRGFHELKKDTKFNYTQIIDEGKIQIAFSDFTKINIAVNDSKYNVHNNDYFKSMFYEVEQERGFYALENHLVPGTFEIDLKPNEDKEITFVCSLEGKDGISFDDITNVNGYDVIKKEMYRIERQINNSFLLDNLPKIREDYNIYQEIVEDYIVASDNFIVKRESTGLHTLIAGYPWFLDWARDSFISFEGLLLISKRFDIAEEVLLTFSRSMKRGIIANGFLEDEDTPIYNSVDGSLLFFNAVDKYLEYTGNYQFVRNNLYKTMESIIKYYIEGTNLDGNNIEMDEKDFLLFSGTSKTQNTWMDAKANGEAVTPRNGKAVEVNALWYNALKIMENINKDMDNRVRQLQYSYLSQKCKESFINKFYNKEKKCLYDVIDEKDDKIRPNQLFAIGLKYPVLDCNDNMTKNIFITITQKLLTEYGLKTLAEGEEGYCPKYEGNAVQRDRAYHQGTIWPWLLGIYYNSLVNMIKAENDNKRKSQLLDNLTKFKVSIANSFIKEIRNGNTVGSIAEVYDAENPKKGKGCFAQAWSVAEIFRILLENENELLEDEEQ